MCSLGYQHNLISLQETISLFNILPFINMKSPYNGRHTMDIGYVLFFQNKKKILFQYENTHPPSPKILKGKIVYVQTYIYLFIFNIFFQIHAMRILIKKLTEEVLFYYYFILFWGRGAGGGFVFFFQLKVLSSLAVNIFIKCFQSVSDCLALSY